MEKRDRACKKCACSNYSKDGWTCRHLPSNGPLGMFVDKDYWCSFFHFNPDWEKEIPEKRCATCMYSIVTGKEDSVWLDKPCSKGIKDTPSDKCEWFEDAAAFILEHMLLKKPHFKWREK